MRFLLPFLVLAVILEQTCVSAMIEGLYCGAENCYEVLGVTSDTPKNEMGKAYRKLARIHHPDKHQTPEAKADAEKKFQLLATAYEVLRDDETKADYDYMLNNPEEYYEHYYRYYKRRYAPQIDIRLVLLVTLTIVSAMQYYTKWHQYDMNLSYLVTVPKYRLQAAEIARRDGIVISAKEKKANKKERKLVTKEEMKKEEDRMIRKIIEEQMDLQLEYPLPSWRDVLWVQIVMFPYTCYSWVTFQLHWLYYFTLLGNPLRETQKLHLIRRYLGLSEREFNAMGENEWQNMLQDELYVWDNFKVWKEECDEEERRQLAENARYKSYRRYMKKGGPGRITFDDD